MKNSIVSGVSIIVAILVITSLCYLTYQRSEFKTMDFEVGDYLAYYSYYGEINQTVEHQENQRYTVLAIQDRNITWKVTEGSWSYEITTLNTNITPDNFNVANPHPWLKIRYLGNETIQTKWGNISCAKYHLKMDGLPDWFFDYWIYNGVVLKNSGLGWVNPWPGAPLLTTVLIDTNIQEIIDH